MGDDPYDFEIAIPSHKAEESSRYAAQSDEDEDEDESEQELEESDSPKRKPQQQQPKRTPTTTAGSSSALDKAKSFLSKYSSKPVAGGGASIERSSSRRRIELSMDDSSDNFNDSDEDSDGVKSMTKETKPVQAAKVMSSDDENDSDDDDREKTTVSSAPVHSTTSRHETSYSEDENENEEDASASFANESDEGPPPPFNAPAVDYQQPKPASTPAPTVRAASTWQNPLQSTSKKSDSSGSSIASQSDDFVQSFEDDEASTSIEIKRPSVAITAEPAPTYGEASESEVYEEEAFDEESAAIEPVLTSPPIGRTDLVPADTTKIEPNFDYSMDFSDDEVDAISTQAKEPVNIQTNIPCALEHHSEEEASKSESFDGKSEAERSEYLQSDEEGPNNYDQPEEDETKNSCEEQQEILFRGTSPGTEMPAFAGNYIPHAEQEEEIEQLTHIEQTDNTRGVSTTALIATPLEPRDRVKPPAAAPFTRQRVVIVREYEKRDGERPEMRDASTQFTGNHAGIQAELVPEGMHNLIPRSSSSPVQQQQSQPEPNFASDNINSSSSRPTGSTLPPPPPQMTPPPLSVENCGYSMGSIHTYSMSNTSVYKQQLLDLQRQIQLKKQETEKLVRDRMAFQYSSFRGTERFIDINRPARMQLWEALMRVDPMLDEAKAREIARLTGSHTGS